MAYYIEHTRSYHTHDTYNVSFYNKNVLTTVTHDPNIVSQWISNIENFHSRRLHRLIVGLDAEWRPSFTRNLRFPVATLQLCVGRRCLIYQIIHSNYIPHSLVEFLLNTDYTFVGVGVHDDVNRLAKDYQIEGFVQAVDLRRLAEYVYDDVNMMSLGLKSLAKYVLDVDLEKPQSVRVSRWDNRFLTENQVMYAAVDAIASFEIGMELEACDCWFAD